MGGGGTAPTQYGKEALQIPDALRQQIDTWNGYTQNEVGVANQAARDAASGYQTNFLQHAPTLNTQFAPPKFSDQLDAFSQNLVSQGSQDAASRLAAQQRQIGQQFGGSNPALAQILQAQAGVQSQLGQNPAIFQAGLAQRAREGQEYQLGQQAQSLSNQAQLAQTNARANLQNLGNQALSQRTQLSSIPLQNNQTLLSVLTALAGLTGTKTSSPMDGDPSAKGPVPAGTYGNQTANGMPYRTLSPFEQSMFPGAKGMAFNGSPVY